MNEQGTLKIPGRVRENQGSLHRIGEKPEQMVRYGSGGFLLNPVAGTWNQRGERIV